MCALGAAFFKAEICSGFSRVCDIIVQDWGIQQEDGLEKNLGKLTIV